ncbi:MAG: hypothetical protein Kow0062_28250 [Acidobacteriota bacterium]
MTGCHRGYFCRVCGRYVTDITESALYLRFVLGEVSFEQLYTEPEAHIACVPELARFIADEAFTSPERAERIAWRDGGLRRRQQRVTAAWRRLQELRGSGLAIEDYPLDAVSRAAAPPAAGDSSPGTPDDPCPAPTRRRPTRGS